MTGDAVMTAVRAAGVGEFAWLSADAQPDVAAVTPLALGDAPAVALPYAYADLARSMGAADQVALVLSDGRSSGSGWQPTAVLGRPRLIEDHDGALFAERLLPQELRKFPPSRTLADSPILQREHWWYLPRLIVVVEPESVMAVPARDGGTRDGVLAIAQRESETVEMSARLAVDVVTVGQRLDRTLELTVRDDALSLSAAADGRPGALLCHDFSAPDMERWVSWTGHGRLTRSGSLGLEVERETGDVELPEPLGLMARIRRQRDLARACRRAL